MVLCFIVLQNNASEREGQGFGFGVRQLSGSFTSPASSSQERS